MAAACWTDACILGWPKIEAKELADALLDWVVVCDVGGAAEDRMRAGLELLGIALFFKREAPG